MDFKIKVEEANIFAEQFPDLAAEAVYSDGVLSMPDTKAAVAKKAIATLPGLMAQASSQALFCYAADKRWRVETGGIVLNGMKIATDRESQSMIGNAVQITGMTGQPIKFKTDSGFVELTPEQMQGVALAVAAHVQTCFTTEAAIDADITAGKITSTHQIDDYEWPDGAS